MSKLLSDQIRDAVRKSGLSGYRICEKTGIEPASLSRFLSGERGMSLASLDKLAALLRLKIVVERKRKDD